MRAQTTFLFWSGVVGWIVYGCGGQSEIQRPGSGAAGDGHAGKAGFAGSATRAGRGPTAAGGSASGHGGSDSGRSGEGGATTGGTAIGRGGRTTGGRGGTAGSTQQGGAGSHSVPDGCFDPDNSEGGVGFCYFAADCECTGSAEWDFGIDYDQRSSSNCGEPRTCTAAICRNDGCNDWYEPFIVETRCCADGRWHLIDGAFQLAENQDWDIDLRASELSPACGGTAAPSSHALHFDGASRLELPLSRRTMRSPAVELWFRTRSDTTPLLSSADTPDTLYLDEGRICFYGGPDSGELCTEERGFADGSWHHAAFSRLEYFTAEDFVNGALYADGTLRVVGQPGRGGPTANFRAGLGRVGANATEVPFMGDLDEIRVWAVGPNPLEILDYYTTTIVGPVHRANLVGYFPLEESGSVATIANRAEPEPVREMNCDLYDWTRNPTYEGSASGGEAGNAGGPNAPSPPADGTLVGFDFSSSPWITPGAF